VAIGGGQEDEGLAEAGDENGDNVEEFGAIGSKGEDDGDGAGGPCADLEGIVEAELDGSGLESERTTENLGDFGPVEFQRNDFVGQDGIGFASLRAALANAVESAVFLGDDFVEAGTVERAGNGGCGVVASRFEEEGGESLEFRAEMAFPGGRESAATGDRFKGEPEGGGRLSGGSGSHLSRNIRQC